MNYTETESKVREATNDDPWGPSGQLMGEIARQVGFFWWFIFDFSKFFILTLNLSTVTHTYDMESLLSFAYLRFQFRATFMYEQFPEVMNMLWTRMLKDNKKNWRRVYKVCFTDDDPGVLFCCNRSWALPSFLPQSLLLLAYLIRNGSERVVTSAREHLYDLRSIESFHCIGKWTAQRQELISFFCLTCTLFDAFKWWMNGLCDFRWEWQRPGCQCASEGKGADRVCPGWW